MMVKYTVHFESRIKNKLKKSPALGSQIKKQIALLRNDIRHPSLIVHKLTGRLTVEYAFWIEGILRITFLIFDNYYLYTDMITHDEY